MEETITLTIPAEWLEGKNWDQKELHQAFRWGLEKLRQGTEKRESPDEVIRALLSTGCIRHLSGTGIEDAPRQSPPALSGIPTSEVLIAQRR